MTWLCLEGIAETPIALPRCAEAGNFYESLPEVPGTAMRGALAGRYIRGQGWVDRVPENKEGEIFEKWFENHMIRFGPLRPLPDDLPEEITAVTFPVPRSARSCKYEGGIEDKHGVFDSLLFQARASNEPIDEKKRKCPLCQAPLEPLDTIWLVANWDDNLDSGSGIDYDPDYRISTHVGIGPAVGETANLSEEGRLFSLQHFPAGTRFRGWIAVGDSDMNLSQLGFDKIGEEHSIILRVGRRSKSLGALKVWISAKSEQSPWEQSHKSVEKRFDNFQTAKDDVKKAKSFPFIEEEFVIFSLTFLTDTILFDDFLRPCRSITAYQIAERLGLNKSSVCRSGVYTGTRLIAGWNAAHRLPKENDIAIVAGSVFLFAVRKKDLEEKEINLLQRLIDMENKGIGWRRSEGFGQVLVCDPFHLQTKRDFIPMGKTEEEKCSRDAVKLNPISGEKKIKSEREEPLVPFDSNVLNFLEQNAEILHDNRNQVTKTQLNSITDRVLRYHQFVTEEGSRKKHLKKYLEHAQEKSKSSCWTVGMKDGKKLAESLINLFGLKDETPWEDVRRRADDFVRGALVIVSSEKPPKLSSKFSFTKEETNE